MDMVIYRISQVVKQEEKDNKKAAPYNYETAIVLKRL